ncbi:hypothetical protein Sjap_003270 [Stephania japonica]|uniref:Uncharacterized protein n=1 Tax=Stephania japonica TaxID=461633 RepID=A0AAP0KR27_9MAGN
MPEGTRWRERREERRAVEVENEEKRDARERRSWKTGRHDDDVNSNRADLAQLQEIDGQRAGAMASALGEPEKGIRKTQWTKMRTGKRFGGTNRPGFGTVLGGHPSLRPSDLGIIPTNAFHLSWRHTIYELPAVSGSRLTAEEKGKGKL